MPKASTDKRRKTIRQSATGPAAASPRKRSAAVRSVVAATATAASAEESAAIRNGPCIVGIGASAGGFESIRDFFRLMPSDSGMAFVVIQHLDPTHKSLAAELLGKCTAMQVAQAENGMPVRANCVYTIPSGRHLSISQGVLHLSTPKEERSRRLPIDFFFRSLGEDRHEKAIGIVFSGTGSDGAIGLKAIAANGGIVLAQRPETAQFDGMPLAAIGTGLVHQVLPVEEMPPVLVGYARHPYAAGAAAIAPPDQTAALIAIIDLLRTRHRYNFAGYKQTTLLRRIQRRMGLRSIAEIELYAALLAREPEEVDALFKDLLIGVTEFFRDPQAWDALDSEVVVPLVAGKGRDEPIRVWVPGAATGEEAYSLAILLLERVRDAGKRCPVQVFATDTNENALAFARAGNYPLGVAASVSAQRLHQFFIEATDNHHYLVRPPLREAVVFGQQNLFSDPPFSRMDLVSCRNLLIYLEPEIQKKAIVLFHFALRPDGYLFLGTAETVGERDDLFKPLAKKWRLYRRIGATVREQLDLSIAAGGHRAAAVAAVPRPLTPRDSELAKTAQKLLLDRFAPASVLINKKLDVIYFCGPTERFLKQPRGVPTRELLTLLRDGLRSHVRSTVREAVDSAATVRTDNARVRRGQGYDPVKLTVIPAGPAGERSQMLLVVFEDLPHKASARPRAGTRQATLVTQMEDELRVTKDDLQATVARLESANEELRSSNEEVVSINEELQSINEELESSKEELQSVNEELSTVNQQLLGKVSELEVANSDLANLLASSDICTICLDREQRIKWFSPAASKAFKILDADVGRPVTDLASMHSDPQLIADTERVLDRPEPVEVEVRAPDARLYLRRVLPYRTADDRVDGVVVTYTDITEAHRKTDLELEARKKQAALLERRVRDRTKSLRAMMFELAMAEERERRNLATDLHDDLGQTLAVANIRLATLTKDGSDDKVKELQQIGTLIEQAERSVRSLVFQVSPPILFELGLLPAMQWLVEEIRRLYGIVVNLRDDGRGKALDHALRSVVFRCVRELLINVAKHAKVGAAEVALATESESLVIAVSDHGIGFDASEIDRTISGGGFGLVSIRERINHLGGDVKVESGPQGGTTITLTVPLSVPEQQPQTGDA